MNETKANLEKVVSALYASAYEAFTIDGDAKRQRELYKMADEIQAEIRAI